MKRIKRWLHKITDDGPDNISFRDAVKIMARNERRQRLEGIRRARIVAALDVVYSAWSRVSDRVRKLILDIREHFL